MTKIIVSEFISIDGVVEAPGGEPGYRHTGWVADFFDEEIGAHKLQEILEAERHLLGRVTYESFAGAWPERDGPYADKINAMPKHVVSGTLGELSWENCSLIDGAGDVPAAVGDVRRGAAGPVLVAGSITLVATLMAHGLVDEYRLMVFPVVLGSGRRLFPEREDKLALDLTATRTFAGGVVEHRYVPAAGSR